MKTTGGSHQWSSALAALLLAWACADARAGLLTAQGAAVLDTTGGQRTTFSSTERLGLRQQVHNGAASSDRISFRFQVFSPSNAKVFEHSGNSVPGSVGAAAGSVSGVPVSGFFTGPGVYTMKAQATLDGQTVEQQVTFTVSSPNIILIYPSDGVRDVADRPLTFRWSSSGATRYRVTVGNNPSFYNSLFSELTSGGETFLTYPENPADSRQRLASGQVYYWKVEGLDAAGAKVAESAAPFSFSVRTTALSRDLAVTSLEVLPQAGSQQTLTFKAAAANQGGTNETNFPLKMSLAGLPASGSPVTLSLNAGQSREFQFTADLPPGQGENLAVACIEFFDDNVANNCKTLRVVAPSAGGAEAQGAAPCASMTPAQVWQAVRELLREKGIIAQLDDYSLIGFGGNPTAAQLCALLEQLRRGTVQVSLIAQPGRGYRPPGASAAGPAPAPGPRATLPEGKEWTGMAKPLAKGTRFLRITTLRAWAKLWQQLRPGEPVPEVDFTEQMVLGVAGGRDELADRAAIEAVQASSDRLLVLYRMVLNRRWFEGLRKKREPREFSPYVLRVVQRTNLDVAFEPVDKEEQEKDGGKPNDKKKGR